MWAEPGAHVQAICFAQVKAGMLTVLTIFQEPVVEADAVGIRAMT